MSLFEHFKDINDPRVDRTKVHRLLDIIAITVVGVLSGADGWDQIVVFAKARKSWLSNFCDLSSGIPSADTIRRVISRINPEEFEDAFRSWINASHGLIEGLIAVDGKTIKNKQVSHPLHILSAYSDSLGVSIGQIPTGNKGGEYEAIPKLLKSLDVSGCLITIDAGGCYKEIAAAIVDETEADYLLQVKGNQPLLQDELSNYFEHADGELVEGASRFVQEEKGHGRHEKRTAYYCAHTKALPQLAKWRGVSSFGMIINERTIGDAKTTERHYYICSRKLSASKLAASCRAHWGVENKLHWVLDTTFSEDGNRVRSEYGQQNLSLARKISIAMLKSDNSKLSIKQRKFRASIDEDYLTYLVGLKGI